MLAPDEYEGEGGGCEVSSVRKVDEYRDVYWHQAMFLYRMTPTRAKDGKDKNAMAPKKK